MQRLWPATPSASVTDAELERIYAYPDQLTRPWVQVNFVSSADGAATVKGTSHGLSHPADKRIFSLGRDLADVILVGAGTVRAENYRGAVITAEGQVRRARLGLANTPPIAVVSGNANLEPDAPLFTETTVPPIVFTTARAWESRRVELANAGAEVVLCGKDRVELAAVLAELARRGLMRINCEGGPRLFGALIAEDLVDQLCLTIAPTLVGAEAGRIATGLPSPVERPMRLMSMLYEDGFSLLRYRRDREHERPPSA